jgi:hypothetical protein
MKESNHKYRWWYFILPVRDFISAFWKTILLWLIIATIVGIGLYFHVDKTALGVVILIFGLITQAFTGLINIIGLIPIIGPIIAQLLALPFFWLLNSLGYFASLVAIRRGYHKQVINYRVLTVVLLIGIIIGYILGKLI